jgi:hypothetical protein
MGLIIVDNPISCMVIDVPEPTLLLLPPSFAKVLHSGPPDSLSSEITTPHVLHNFSPVFSSITKDDLLHAGHRSKFDNFYV